MSRLSQLCLVTLMAIVCLSIFVSQTEGVPVETSSAAPVTTLATITEVSTKKDLLCSEGNPCGWAVYGAASKTKKTQFFIRNTCRCRDEAACILSNEDLSLSAFVYRCKTKSKDNA